MMLTDSTTRDDRLTIRPVSKEMARLHRQLAEILDLLVETPTYWLSLVSKEITAPNHQPGVLAGWHTARVRVNTATLLRTLAEIQNQSNTERHPPGE